MEHAGVDEVKIEGQKVVVIGEVDPGKLSGEIKKVGLKECCFGYMKGGKELAVEIMTVGKPPVAQKVEKPKCKTCNEECCVICKKCHNTKCKDCVRCCCKQCQSSCPPTICCDPPPPPPINPCYQYRGFPGAQIIDCPPTYDNYGGGCSIL